MTSAVDWWTVTVWTGEEDASESRAMWMVCMEAAMSTVERKERRYIDARNMLLLKSCSRDKSWLSEPSLKAVNNLGQ